MSRKIPVRLFVLVVLGVGGFFLLTVIGKMHGERLYVVRKKQPSNSISTSDEMRYIRYGVGDQFFQYEQQLIDYIRSHISKPSLTRPRQLATPQKADWSEFGQSTLVDKLLYLDVKMVSSLSAAQPTESFPQTRYYSN